MRAGDDEDGAMQGSDDELMRFDLLPLADRLALMNRADAAVPALVAAVADQIARLVECAVAVLRGGGRVIYLGAGSAGRIAAQDAAEVGPRTASRTRSSRWSQAASMPFATRS